MISNKGQNTVVIHTDQRDQRGERGAGAGAGGEGGLKGWLVETRGQIVFVERTTMSVNHSTKEVKLNLSRSLGQKELHQTPLNTRHSQ